jgi:hypothetical protein
MHRRARHLNAKDAGAVLVLDSRFITGLANNDLVDPWTDRVSAINYTITTSANRPVYKTAVQGGQPMVLSEALKQLSGNSSGLVNYTSNNLTIVTVNSHTGFIGDTVMLSIRSTSSSEFLIYRNGTDSYWGFRGLAGRRWVGPSSNVIAIESLQGDVPFINGVSISSSSHTHGGSGNNNTLFNITGVPASWRGNLGILSVWNSVINATLFRRLNHAAAFSFKISCN